MPLVVACGVDVVTGPSATDAVRCYTVCEPVHEHRQETFKGQVGPWRLVKRRPGGCDACLDVPTSFLSAVKDEFFSSVQTGLETTLLTGHQHRDVESRQRLWMSITGSSSGDA